jgi:hypothetical protein
LRPPINAKTLKFQNSLRLQTENNIGLLSINFNSIPFFETQIASRSIAIMAEGGIDRKAEERMEFTTSKDVTVAPTFTDSKSSRDALFFATTPLSFSSNLC